MDIDDMPELLTPAEAAKWLRLSVKTLYDRKSRGALPPGAAVKIGNGRHAPLRFRRRELQSMLREVPSAREQLAGRPAPVADIDLRAMRLRPAVLPPVHETIMALRDPSVDPLGVPPPDLLGLDPR